MASKEQFHQMIKGSLGQTEDWWNLIAADDDTIHVEHKWSHHDPYGKAKPNSGTREYTVEEFLGGSHNEAAKANLRNMLDKKGLR